MITLLTFSSGFGQFSGSPFCTKVAYLLVMAGVEWQREDINDPRKMPYGKLPAIRVGDQIIADSDRIQSYLEKQGADFDSGLSELDRSAARALIRLSEEHLYFHIMLDRWGNDAVWPTIRDAYFGNIPKMMRGLITNSLRRKVLAGLEVQGLGRFSEAERLERVDLDLKAISDRLWQGGYLFGDKPCAADASVAAMLGAMGSTPCDTALSRRVSENGLLTGYLDRMEKLLKEDAARRVTSLKVA